MSTAIVHQDNGGAMFGNHSGHSFVLLESPDIIDYLRAGLQAGLGDGGFVRIHGNHHVRQFLPEEGKDRQKRFKLHLRADGPRPGAGGFSPKVQDIRAFRHEAPGLGKRFFEGVRFLE